MAEDTSLEAQLPHQSIAHVHRKHHLDTAEHMVRASVLVQAHGECRAHTACRAIEQTFRNIVSWMASFHAGD